MTLPYLSVAVLLAPAILLLAWSPKGGTPKKSDQYSISGIGSVTELVTRLPRKDTRLLSPILLGLLDVAEDCQLRSGNPRVGHAMWCFDE